MNNKKAVIYVAYVILNVINFFQFYFVCPKFVVKDRFEPIELKWSLQF